MTRANLALFQSLRSKRSSDKALCLLNGFTLPEVLVSAVVLLIALSGGIAAFNLVTQSIRRTEISADQSRRIDLDLAGIARLSELYTSCVNPAGSIPPDPATDCLGDDVEVGNSYYYFPDPVNPLDVNNFFLACRSTVATSHITQNFIAALNNVSLLPQPGGAVVRQNAIRVPPVTDAANHLVEITWIDPTRNNRVLKSVRVVPIVSSWCP